MTTAPEAPPRRLVIHKQAIFTKVGYVPHRAQRPLHRSTARNKVAAMGRRTGKSTAGGNELVVESVVARAMLRRLEDLGRRREFWIVGPNYTDSEKEFRVLYNTLVRMGAPLDKPGTYYDAHAGDMQLSMYKGKFLVIGKSAAHPERLVGEGLNGVIMAEAAKMRETTWVKYVRPMLADYKGWAQFNSTPEGKNWFYQLWMKGQSFEDDAWDSWRLPAWFNDIVFPGGRHDPEILQMYRDLPTEVFNQEVACKFTEYVGRVFKDFDEEIHVPKQHMVLSSDRATYAAVDYGFTNPFVWLLLQVDRHGNVYIIDEMYEPGLTIDEAAVEVAARGLCPPGLVAFAPDPASPGDTKALEKKLRVKSMGGTGGELEIRLRLIRAMLKERNTHLAFGHPDRLPRLFINRKCTNTIHEFNDYRYPKTAEEAAERGQNAPEKPLKKDDHTPEALGRFMVAYFGTGSRAEGSRVSQGSFGR